MAALMLPLVLLMAITAIQNSNAAKIVGFPMIGGSQYMGMKRIAEELVSRGHEVTLLVSGIQKFKPSSDIKHAVYKVPVENDYIENHLIKHEIKYGIRSAFMPTGMLATQKLFCEAMLNATKILEPLKKYDLIIIDCIMFCGPVLADYLDILRIDFCPMPARSPLMYFHHAPASLSYVPQSMTRNPEAMSFLQRVKNTLHYLGGVMMFHLVLKRDYNAIKQRYNIKPQRCYSEAMGDTEMVLFLADHALEYSFPLLPSHKFIGPINIHVPRPLTPDYQQLMDESGEHGAIIVSFGSNVASILEKREVDVLAEAFGRLQQTVIWRLKGYVPSDMSPNIKVVAWMPQTDLLAHEKMRVFVSHVGLNSLYESAFYGVPLVGVPLFADQPDQAAFLEEKDLGLSVDIHTVTADQLYTVIRRVIDEKRFKTNAQRISRLMKDRRRTPAEEAADWVEYTLRHGRLTHLRPASVHLTWYQYLLLDVALFLVMVLLAVAMVIRLIYRCLCLLCCSRTGKAKVH